jgi:threonine dehydrogenase-like Zn-dependent dehydrogenase
MKALVYTGVEEMALRDMPDPEPQAGEVLIRVDSVGICGSDMHAYLGHDDRRPAPLVLGHEAAGVIIGGAREGERVTINPLVTCGRCAYCTSGRENLCPERQIISMPPREGAFAQLLRMPERNLVTVPEGVSLTQAALAEPIAVSWHGVRLGLAALHDAMEAACAGDRRRRHRPCRRPLAQGDGGGGRETGGAHGGVIVHIGLGEDMGGLDIRRMTLQEITFIGTYTYTAQDFRDTAAAMFAGKLGPLDWAETRPLAQGPRAFGDIRSGVVAAPKIILQPHG